MLCWLPGWKSPLRAVNPSQVRNSGSGNGGMNGYDFIDNSGLTPTRLPCAPFRHKSNVHNIERVRCTPRIGVDKPHRVGALPRSQRQQRQPLSFAHAIPVTLKHTEAVGPPAGNKGHLSYAAPHTNLIHSMYIQRHAEYFTDHQVAIRCLCLVFPGRSLGM